MKIEDDDKYLVNSKIDVYLYKHRQSINKGLNIGCGDHLIKELINCDFYNKKADIATSAYQLPMFDNNSIDWIEAHHLIEHLSFRETDMALKEWYRILNNKGFLILTFPDIEAIAKLLFNNPEHINSIVPMLVGSQENEGMFHKNAYNLNRMFQILHMHNFNIEYTYYPYPVRPTPSRIVIARKVA